MITRKSRRTAYENPWMSVYEDEVTFADGSPGIYGVVEKKDCAAIVPCHADGRIQLVSLYRYAVGARFWEVPQGGWEGEGPVDGTALARAELAEETGFTAAEVTRLGAFYESYGYAKQLCHVFAARGLTPGPTKHDAGELGMETAAFTRAEIATMIGAGDIADSVTIAALGLFDLAAAR